MMMDDDGRAKFNIRSELFRKLDFQFEMMLDEIFDFRLREAGLLKDNGWR